MKKILLTTSALVAFAGAASAEIAISGSAEMGFVGGGDNNISFAAGGETQFHNDITLSIKATGVTDGGLSFGSLFDFSKVEGNANGNVSIDNEAAFISGSFGTLTMGEIDGAMDWAITESVGNPGSIGDDETMHAGYMGSFGDGFYDNQIVRYDYSMGDFGFALSAELDDDVAGRSTNYAAGVTYKTTFGSTALGFGLAYQSFEALGYLPGNLGGDGGYGDATGTSAYDPVTGWNTAGLGLDGNIDIVAVSVNADMGNGFVAGLAYSDWSADNADATQTQLSLGYTTGAISVGANYGVYDIDGLGKIKGFGLAAAYDLGGGLSVHAGYGDSSWDNVFGPDDGFETYSVGVAMAF
ncbi:porin [Phaeovulum sp.]|uniref:porin n=1 Tax=Phaeovulum sp. TaxID=2934796 RepID=UPI0039E65A3A